MRRSCGRDHATSCIELVCEAAATGGRFTSTTIALAKPGSDFMEIVAGAGPTGQSARQVTLSISEAHPEGRGVCGITFRSGQACIFNDYLADPRAAAFHAKARERRLKVGRRLSAASCEGGWSASCSSSPCEKDTFTPEFTELLQRLADNVSFALENFDRADEKAKTEEQKERLTRMFAALSATNEAIMRAKTRAEMFELVCEAAANGGKFTSTTIALARAGQRLSGHRAAAGPTAASSREVPAVDQ